MLYILIVVVTRFQIRGPRSPIHSVHSYILSPWNLGMRFVRVDTVKESSSSSPDSPWHTSLASLYLASSLAAHWTHHSWKASLAPPLHSPSLGHKISPPGKQSLQLSYSLKFVDTSNLMSLLLLSFEFLL